MPSYTSSGHKVVVKLRCLECGLKYKRTLPSADTPDPPCPTCSTPQPKPRGFKFNGKAPGKIGMNNSVRAMDLTAEVVMKDYGMTDLRDAPRSGDTMAPRLPPDQQARADNFFTSGARASQTNPALAAQVGKMQTLASSGALASQPDAQFVSSVLSRKDIGLRRVATAKA